MADKKMTVNQETEAINNTYRGSDAKRKKLMAIWAMGFDTAKAIYGEPEEPDSEGLPI